MKVMRITTCLNFGGVERNFEIHARYHKQQDYELVMVALENGGRAEEFIRSCGIRVIVLNGKARVPSLKCLLRLFALIREEKPDVVHASCAEGNFHGLIAGWLTGVPVRIGEEIGIPGHSRMARFVFSSVYRTAHRVIGISKAVAAYLTKYEVAPKKVEMVYYPIDIDAVHGPKKRLENTFVIATVCRLEEVKNLPILLELLAEITKRHPQRAFELWFLGDGSQRGLLVNKTNELGIARQVKFFGYLEHPQEVLVDADLFILPSWKEGFGLACIEAIQCGLPVIVSRSGGMVEYITDGVNGYLFDPKSLEELIIKTEMLLALEPTAVKAMVAKASVTVRDLFSPEIYRRELNRIYRLQPKSVQSQNPG